MTKRREQSIKKAFDLFDELEEEAARRYVHAEYLDIYKRCAVFIAAAIFESLERIEDALLRKRVNTKTSK